MKTLFIVVMMLMPFTAQAAKITDVVYGGCFGSNATDITKIVETVTPIMTVGLVLTVAIKLIKKYRNKKNNLTKE